MNQNWTPFDGSASGTTSGGQPGQYGAIPHQVPPAAWPGYAGTPAPPARPTSRGSLPRAAWIGIAAAALAVVGLVAAVAINSSGNRYPETVRTNFVASCLASGGNASGCSCALDAVEDEFSYEEFVNYEQQYVSTGRMPSAIVNLMVSKCELA